MRVFISSSGGRWRSFVPWNKKNWGRFNGRCSKTSLGPIIRPTATRAPPIKTNTRVVSLKQYQSSFQLNNRKAAAADNQFSNIYYTREARPIRAPNKYIQEMNALKLKSTSKIKAKSCFSNKVYFLTSRHTWAHWPQRRQKELARSLFQRPLSNFHLVWNADEGCC